MDSKKLEEMMDAFISALEENSEDDDKELKEFEKSKKELKEEIIERIDNTKDVIIAITDEQGTVMGGKRDVIASVLSLLDNIYTQCSKQEKKSIRRMIEDKIFED